MMPLRRKNRRSGHAEAAQFLDRQGFMSYIPAIEMSLEAAVKRISAALVVVVSMAPAFASGTVGRDLSLASILAAAGERGLGGEIDAQGPGAIFAAMTGVDSLPVPCGTPILLGLGRVESPAAALLRPAVTALTARPALDSERVVVTRDGHFAIHYSDAASTFGLRPADRDRNGLPDPIDRVAEAAVAARSHLVGRLGYASPAAEGQRYDIYITGLGHGIEGFTVPPGAKSPAAEPFSVLDANLPADRVMAATLHQLAHAVFGESATRVEPWWSEASAGFLEATGTDDFRSPGPALSARQGAPWHALASDDLLMMQGALLWPLFLAERSGDAGIVRQVWAEIASKGLDPFAAADQVLRRRAGGSLAEAFREYTLWNLFTGARDDGRHFASGRLIPELSVAMLGADLPITLDPVEGVDSLGSVAFHLPGGHTRGALDLEVRADGGTPSIDLLISYRDGSQGPVLVPVALAPDGRGRASIPWSEAQEAWIILRNGALPGTAAARFEIRGVRNPYAPFDLAALTAEPVGATMLLQWTTASETGLVGWNVYRGESPAGPFARINAVAVPAFGDGTADTGYLFVDGVVRPGRRYYYLVEGTTSLGLAERSQVVSGRL